MYSVENDIFCLCDVIPFVALCGQWQTLVSYHSSIFTFNVATKQALQESMHFIA